MLMRRNGVQHDTAVADHVDLPDRQEMEVTSLCCMCATGEGGGLTAGMTPGPLFRASLGLQEIASAWRPYRTVGSWCVADAAVWRFEAGPPHPIQHIRFGQSDLRWAGINTLLLDPRPTDFGCWRAEACCCCWRYMWHVVETAEAAYTYGGDS